MTTPSAESLVLTTSEVVRGQPVLLMYLDAETRGEYVDTHRAHHSGWMLTHGVVEDEGDIDYVPLARVQPVLDEHALAALAGGEPGWYVREAANQPFHRDDDVEIDDDFEIVDDDR